jgi:MFS family permease
MKVDQDTVLSGQQAVYTKILWRLIPVLFLSYLFCSMDRFNIAFAQFELREQLHLSYAAYGLGASLFFVAYVIFEIPSNLLLRRWGAKRLFCAIMLGWGITSTCMLFIRTPEQFYAGRILLGALEAGFYPGVIYYLSSWLPSGGRGKAFSIFEIGYILAGVVVGPLSGWIITSFEGQAGLAGWQWLFLLEGLPSCVMAIVCFFVLSDSPEKAGWLSQDEVRILNNALEHDRANAPFRLGGKTVISLLGEPKIYFFALIFFCTTSGIYALNFWVPTIIKSFGVGGVLQVGLYSAVPWGIATIATIIIAFHSDRSGERRWHFAITAFVGAAGLALSTIPHLPLIPALVFLSLGTIGVSATLPVFWTLPSAFISTPLVAGGLALINTLGVTSGIVSPFLLGVIKQLTGSLTNGMYFLAAVLAFGGLILLAIVPRTIALRAASSFTPRVKADQSIQ